MSKKFDDLHAKIDANHAEVQRQNEERHSVIQELLQDHQAAIIKATTPLKKVAKKAPAKKTTKRGLKK